MSKALKEILTEIVEWLGELEDVVNDNYTEVHGTDYEYITDSEDYKLLKMRIQELRL